MKMVVEKHICDVCGIEVTTDTRYVIELSAKLSWDDNAETDEQNSIKKDLCHDCYKTIGQLLGLKTTHEESKHEEEKPRVKGAYDKDLIKELWAKGFTYKQIQAKTGATISQITYTINKLSKEERQELKDKYAIHTKPIHEEEHGRMKVTMDQYGCIMSTEMED